MSGTSARLLQAASEVAGGPGPLARRLGLSEAMLRKYLSATLPLPDALLLRAVDLILEERETRAPNAAEPRPKAGDGHVEA